MDSKESSPKTVLPLVCLRNLPAVAPQQQAACGHCGDGLSDNFNFFKLNAFTFPKERLKQDGREVSSKMCNISSVVFDCRDDNYTWFTLWTQRNPGISLSQQLVAPIVAKVRLPTLRRQATLAQRRSTEWTPFGFRAREQLLPKGLREGLRIIQAHFI